MVIASIPNVIVLTIQTRDTDTMEMNDTTITSSIPNDQQEPTDMLHALHHDEKELRILAVVLSLTGGLALSFLLGVGIFVYWHWRAWRVRRRKKYMKSKRRRYSIKPGAIETASLSSAHTSRSTSPIPSPSSSSSLVIDAIDTSRQREDTSVSSPRSHTIPPTNPTASSSISSTSSSPSSSSSSSSQRNPSSPTIAASSFVSISHSIPSDISVHNHTGNTNHFIPNVPDITKRDIMNDSAIYRPSPIMTNYNKAGCSTIPTSSSHSYSTPIIPPLLLESTSSSTPIPTAPPAKECLDSPSPSTLPQEPSFDPPDIPPPAYSPN